MNLNQKYRPQRFEDVCGQTMTVRILQRVVDNKNFKNCFLFAGTTGSGKTTCARLFAKAINNGLGNPIEIDAASNSGVDNVRMIVEAANQRDLVAEYKVFIIDECHSLSSAAWQAFLKCIEECPKYTIFIFCTTEINKVPKTILNRVQTYNFAPISMTDIRNRLMYICQQEGFTNYEQACDFISKSCNGCMRDAITSLEQCADYSTDLSIENVKMLLPALSYENMFKLTWALQQQNEADTLALIDSLYAAGQDIKNFVNLYTNFVLNLLKYILFKNIDVTELPAYLATEQNPVVQYTVKDENSKDYFNKLVEALLALKELLRYDSSSKTTTELALIKFIRN